MQPRRGATSLGVLALVFWSFSALATVEVKTVPVYEMTAILHGIACVFTAIRLTVKRSWGTVLQPFWIYLVGGAILFGNQVCYASAFRCAPADQVDLINYAWPLLLSLTATGRMGERFTIHHLIPSLIGFAGVYLVMTEGRGFGHLSWEYLPGYLMALAAALTWVAYNILSRSLKKAPSEMVGIYCGISAACSLIVHTQVESTTIPPTRELALIFALGGFITFGAYQLWDYSAKHGNLRILSLLSYGTPVASVALLVIAGRVAATSYLAVATLLVTISTAWGVVVEKSRQYASYSHRTPVLRRLASILNVS